MFNGNPGPLMKSPFRFKQYGQSGAWVCEKYPNVAKHVDDFAFIKSLHSESNDHVPALYQINTGIARPGFPAAGAWVTYGLGSENQNLPGYVVLGNNQGIKGGPLNWHAGFLPSTYQGTLFRPEGNPILNLNRPDDVTREDQRRQLDLLARSTPSTCEAHPGEADLLGRIQSFELAYRMQAEGLRLIDLTQESEATRKLYGLDRKETQVVWLEVPAGAPTGRARCALRPGLQRRRMGRPQRSRPATTPAIAWRPTCRSTDCSPT